MQGDALAGWAVSSLVLSLRVAPTFVFAQPFVLVRMPVIFRVLLGVGLAASLAGGAPELARLPDLLPATLVIAIMRELVLGSLFALIFQLAFAALYLAGRTVDIQAGFGLASLIDPTTRTQTPLVGTLYAYAAGMIFFAMNGQADLLRILGASLQAIPLGGAYALPSPLRLAAFLSAACVTSFGVVGGLVLSLFLADMAIALLSRTTPQMNVLVLGFQVKTVILLIALPLTLGIAGALLTKLMASTLLAIPRLI